ACVAVVPVVLGTHHSVPIVAGFDAACLPSDVAGGYGFAFVGVDGAVVVDDDFLGCWEVGVAWRVCPRFEGWFVGGHGWVELVDVDEDSVDHCGSGVHHEPPCMCCNAASACWGTTPLPHILIWFARLTPGTPVTHPSSSPIIHSVSFALSCGFPSRPV